MGVSRAISVGNAAAVGVAEFLGYFADDPATAVSLAYLEGIDDGRALYETLRSATATKPVVLVKGGATREGGRAAASHTGALATDDRVFTGACRQAGVTVAATVDEAYDAAAAFATQPLPRGPNTLVLTTAGGWGVLTADAITRSRLHLVELPDDLLAAIDAKLPPRWSRANPIDLAASETRDTIPEVLELAAHHPEIDAIVFLGLGVQSNQARILRAGRFSNDEGIERIATFHERQDARYAQVAADVSDATGKPVLCASELAVSDPDNPGPRAVRASGRYCTPSPHRAVRALEHLWEYAAAPCEARRMTTARRWIAAVLAIGAVAALVLGFTGDPSASGAAPAPAGATPLWSARRVPQPIVDAVGGQRLQGELDREVGGASTCFMVEDDGALSPAPTWTCRWCPPPPRSSTSPRPRSR